MPAASAKSFLADLRNGCSPIVATGDDCGTVKIEQEITEVSPVFLVRTSGRRQILHRQVIDRSFDSYTTANELLADLGAQEIIARHGSARKAAAGVTACNETGATDLPRVGTSVRPNLNALPHQSSHSIRRPPLLPQYWQQRRCSSYRRPYPDHGHTRGPGPAGTPTGGTPRN